MVLSAGFQPADQGVKNVSPEGMKGRTFSKAAHQDGADGIVSPDKDTPGRRFFQTFVSETAKEPDLRAVIGAIDAGCDVAAFLLGGGLRLFVGGGLRLLWCSVAG